MRQQSLSVPRYAMVTTEQYAAVLDVGIAASTLTQYGRRIGFVRRYFGDRDQTIDAFLGMLFALRSQGAAGSTLTGYRCAWAHHQRRSRQPTWAENEVVKRFCAAFELEDKRVRPQRGMVTREMLGQLCSLDQYYGLAFEVMFWGCLRLEELRRLCVGDYFWDGTTGVLSLRTDKRLRRNARITQTFHKKRCPSHRLRDVLLEAQVALPFGTLVFKRFRPLVARALVKRASELFEWPGGVVYDGVHCIRHGAANEAESFSGMAQALVGEFSAMTQGTRKRYVRPN